LPFLRGITGRLSRENAMRNPRRTASTASALIIGVTLIVFITAFAASVQTSISNSIGNGFKGEYIIQPANQQAFTGVTPKLASQLEKVRGVRIVAAASFTPAQVRLASGARPTAFVGGIDAANYLDVFNVKMQQGSLTDLRKGTVVVDRQIAEKYKVHIGDRVTVLAASGRSAKYRVAAVSDDANLLGQWTLTRSDSAALNAAPTDAFLGVRLDKGTSVDSIRADLKKVVKQYPTMKLQDRDQFIGGIVGQIDQLLVVIYGLLFVSVIIALIGIANTLSLSIHERTRELGLLRAMGMTRSQLRSSVRWEAAIVALMGTAIGLGLGLLLSWTMVKALASQGFSDFQVPLFGWLSLSTIVIAAAALGVVAALRPAHKAAKLNVLDAIATE
jgi:putative ABC transport system permease protein